MKKVFLFIIALMIFVTSCEPVVYNTFGCISVTVIDEIEGTPIQGVNLTLSPHGDSGYTGNDGYWAVCDLESNTYTITVTKDGYQTNRKTIKLDLGKDVDISLPMRKKN